MSLNEESLVQFLKNEMGVDMARGEDTESLFSGGLIDSFALVSLLTFLEIEGGFEVEPSDVTLENMDSVNRIMAFSRRKTISIE